MTDQQFKAELYIRAYKAQIDGYPFGHPRRQSFQPIIPIIEERGGRLNRQRTIEGGTFGKFSDAERYLLLDTEPDWRTALMKARKLFGEESV